MRSTSTDVEYIAFVAVDVGVDDWRKKDTKEGKKEKRTVWYCDCMYLAPLSGSSKWLDASSSPRVVGPATQDD